MDGQSVFLLLVQILTAVSAEFCSEKLSVKLEGDVEEHGGNGSISHANVIYPKSTYWRKGSDVFGCPCQLEQKNCLPICSKDYAAEANFTVPDANFHLKIWHGDNSSSVKLFEHFFPKSESYCTQGFLLEPQNFINDTYRILANGLLYLTNIEDHETQTVFGPAEFCIMNDQSSIAVVLCEELDENELLRLYGIYFVAALMGVSVIFQLLTLAAFCVFPEMQNLHGKSIACQTGTMIIAFFALSFIFFTGSWMSNYVLCKTFAYIAYIFTLSSFFWLNTMCFDIFRTFSSQKNMSQNLQKTKNKKFLPYAIYSTLNPIVMFVIMAATDTTLDNTWRLWPGIGESRCWFKSRWAENIFFQIPIVLLLLVNTIFFTLTIMKIRKLTRETAVLNRADSMIHNKATEEQHRLILYAKLFLLMGGTWLIDSLSWFIGGPESIWIFIASINCCRGVLIFYLCVWSNKKVRSSLTSFTNAKFTSCFGLNKAESLVLSDVERLQNKAIIPVLCQNNDISL